MQKAISHKISENLNEKGAKLRRNNIILCIEVPKWMQLPQPRHLNHVEAAGKTLILRIVAQSQ